MENKKLIFILIFLGSFASVCAQGQLVNNGYEKGYVKNGFKSGLWQYYDSTGILELEIDYTSSTLKYIIPDTSEYIIFENGEWVKSKLDIPPRYIGSSKEFYNILKENVDYPMQARYRDIIGVVWISFEVDTSGKAGNYQIHNEIGGECGYEFLRVLKLIPNYWMVAQKNGKQYQSKLLISCEFGIIMDGKRLKERKKKKKEIPLELPLAKKIDGISYIIKKGYNPK